MPLAGGGFASGGGCASARCSGFWRPVGRRPPASGRPPGLPAGGVLCRSSLALVVAALCPLGTFVALPLSPRVWLVLAPLCVSAAPRALTGRLCARSWPLRPRVCSCSAPSPRPRPRLALSVLAGPLPVAPALPGALAAPLPRSRRRWRGARSRSRVRASPRSSRCPARSRGAPGSPCARLAPPASPSRSAARPRRRRVIRALFGRGRRRRRFQPQISHGLPQIARASRSDPTRNESRFRDDTTPRGQIRICHQGRLFLPGQRPILPSLSGARHCAGTGTTE